MSEISSTPGRKRNPLIDEAILEATLDELAERGYLNLTMDAVARRAGVGRPTVYRRYPNKPALVLAACTSVAARHVPSPNTGSLGGDVEVLLADLTRVFTRTRAAQIVPALLSARDEHPELGAAAEAVWDERRRAMREVLEHARTRGEVDSNLDIEIAIDLLYGPLYLRLLVTQAPITGQLASGLADMALAGLTVRRAENGLEAKER
ncbi:TetR/AcrR family transcriptional regulator [Nocardioides KLBMP 9356]|uniref:TetR/AcrR family transcriptional regulator n=1 Tax=Nocardioides potassii TaxID=2911371 RepID=A0ABS9HD17_9ACTN|nr:TetR/AcrR family transcriptional regulator [Nocardioides potassii]MCF6378125.1 TetR/AcrR family transcriptional regulator [Nocardioides potassii]